MTNECISINVPNNVQYPVYSPAFPRHHSLLDLSTKILIKSDPLLIIRCGQFLLRLWMWTSEVENVSSDILWFLSDNHCHFIAIGAQELSFFSNYTELSMLAGCILISRQVDVHELELLTLLHHRLIDRATHDHFDENELSSQARHHRQSHSINILRVSKSE